MAITSLVPYVAFDTGSSAFQQADGSTRQESIVMAMNMAAPLPDERFVMLRRSPSKENVLAYSLRNADFASANPQISGVTETGNRRAAGEDTGAAGAAMIGEDDQIGKIPNSEVPGQIRSKFPV